jgi:hypothetical protein
MKELKINGNEVLVLVGNSFGYRGCFVKKNEVKMRSLYSKIRHDTNKMFLCRGCFVKEIRWKRGFLPFCGVAFFLVFKEILCALCDTLCVLCVKTTI